jgi:hypothetical protein
MKAKATKSIHQLLRLVSVTAAVVAVFAGNASGTAVLIAISESRILLAADGMSTHTLKGHKTTYSCHCKISQAGDSFLVVVGLEDYRDTGLNIPILARKAFSSGRSDLLAQIGKFEKTANSQIIGTLEYIKSSDPDLYARLPSVSGPPVSVVFAGKIKGALGVVVLEYVEAEGTFKERPRKVTIGSSTPEHRDVGDVAAIDTYLRVFGLHDLEDADGFRKLLDIEIDSQPTQNPSVGRPITILEIRNDGAHWIDQGACADVKTFGRSRKS